MLGIGGMESAAAEPPFVEGATVLTELLDSPAGLRFAWASLGFFAEVVLFFFFAEEAFGRRRGAARFGAVLIGTVMFWGCQHASCRETTYTVRLRLWCGPSHGRDVSIRRVKSFTIVT